MHFVCHAWYVLCPKLRLCPSSQIDEGTVMVLFRNNQHVVARIQTGTPSQHSCRVKTCTSRAMSEPSDASCRKRTNSMPLFHPKTSCRAFLRHSPSLSSHALRNEYDLFNCLNRLLPQAAPSYYYRRQLQYASGVVRYHSYQAEITPSSLPKNAR